MLLLTSWDDLSDSDTRIAQLLLEYNIKGIFYIPFFALDGHEDTALELSKYDLFEIGSHTMTHQPLTRCSKDQVRWELTESKKQLEQYFERDIHSFCYPRGYYNDWVISAVQEAGYQEARTVSSHNIKLPLDFYQIDPTIHLYPGRWEDFKSYLYDPKCEYFHLWGHGWEIDKYNLWEPLEIILKEMSIVQQRHAENLPSK